MGKNKRQDIKFVIPDTSSPHSSEPLLTICGDLICFPNKKDMVSKIGVLGTKRFANKPSPCPCCNKDAVLGVAVLGCQKETLIWQCMNCEERFLKYTRQKTNKFLDLVKDTYTVPDDWGYLPKEEFN